jgi:hypothetical protein
VIGLVSQRKNTTILMEMKPESLITTTHEVEEEVSLNGQVVPRKDTF